MSDGPKNPVPYFPIESRLFNRDPYFMLYEIIPIWVFPKIGGTPKWMVKIMENPLKMDDLGVPLFLETPI